MLIASNSFTQDARTSLSMFSQPVYNPAFVGNSDYGDAFIGMRNQYMDFEDENGNTIGPNILSGAVNAPLKNLNSGLGLSIVQDQIGFETTMDIALAYAYQIKVSEGKLGLGVNLGMLNYKFDISNELYPGGSTTDTYITKLKEDNKNSWKFNSGIGVYYSRSDLYFGASVKNLNEPKLEISSAGDYSGEYKKRHYYITGGYYYQTSNPNLAFMPSVMFKTVGKSASQLNLDLFAEYNRFLIGGVSYTTGNDISAVLGVKIRNGSKLDGMRAVFAYDIVTSQLSGYQSGTFEFQVGYAFNLSVEKTAQTYKSVRFL